MNKVRKSLGLLLPAMRISISLALITACMLLSADMLGYTLDEDGQALENRKQIAESLASQFSVMAPEKDIDKIDHVTMHDPVDQIANGATDNQAQCGSSQLLPGS